MNLMPPSPPFERDELDQALMHLCLSRSFKVEMFPSNEAARLTEAHMGIH
jgi:hypothetical protein